MVVLLGLTGDLGNSSVVPVKRDHATAQTSKIVKPRTQGLFKTALPAEVMGAPTFSLTMQQCAQAAATGQTREYFAGCKFPDLCFFANQM